MRLVTAVSLLVGIVTGSSSTIEATPLTVGGGWQELDWNCGTGLIIAEDCEEDSLDLLETPADGFYAFVLEDIGLLTLTDMFTSGDEFLLEVTHNGGSPTLYQSSNTTAPAFQPCDFQDLMCQSTYGFAAYQNDKDAVAGYYLTQGKYSTLTVALLPGDYMVRFLLTELAPDLSDVFPGEFQTAGLAAVRVDEVAVPEPASVVLLGSGLIGVATAVRRRQQQRRWSYKARTR